MAQFEIWLTRDLDHPNTVEVLDSVLCQGDNNGHRIGVKVQKSGTPQTLSGTVKGFIVKSDGTTTEVNGQRSDNRAWIDLPLIAYSVPGKVQISIRLTDGNNKTILASCQALVILVDTGSDVNENVNYNDSSQDPISVEILDNDIIDVP